jgi:3-deoxy-D-manno-octulosonic acid (KDO) 8-phosphate synthase
MVEVHPRPDEALSDAEQQIDFAAFAELVQAVRPIHEHVRPHRAEPLHGASIGSGGGLSKH